LFGALKSPKATRWAVLGLVGIAFFLRTYTLGTQSLWRDEVDAIRFSSWAIRHLLEGLIQEGHNGPLFFLLLRPWRILAGDSEFALRYPSAFMGTLAVPVGYLLVRQLHLSRETGLLLGLLLATSPYLVWYGQEAKMYAMLLVAVTLALIAYLKALAGGGLRGWVVFVAGTSLSFYLHILAPLMLLVYGGVALVYHQQTRRRWKGWLMSMGCLTLPYLPLVIWQLSFFIEGTDRGHPFYPFQRQFQLLLQLYSSGLFYFSASVSVLRQQIQPYLDPLAQFAGLPVAQPFGGQMMATVGLLPILLALFLFLCGLFLKNRQPGAMATNLNLTRLVLAIWVLVPPLVVYLVSLRIPIFEDRYLIYITPAFYLLLVLGLVYVNQYSTRLAGFCLGLILMINLIGLWHQQRGPVKADFRAAAAYLASQPVKPANIMVQMPYLKHTFNYYYPHKYNLLDGLWTNSGKTEATLGAEMTRLTADLNSLWLVVSEEDTWDNRHLVRGWLDENGWLVDKAHFMRVDVYHYQLRPGAIESQSTAAEP